MSFIQIQIIDIVAGQELSLSDLTKNGLDEVEKLCEDLIDQIDNERLIREDTGVD